MREHPDLRANPALGIDVGGPDMPGSLEVFGFPKGAGRAEHGNKLHDLTGHRVPDEVTGTLLAH